MLIFFNQLSFSFIALFCLSIFICFSFFFVSRFFFIHRQFFSLVCLLARSIVNLFFRLIVLSFIRSMFCSDFFELNNQTIRNLTQEQRSKRTNGPMNKKIDEQENN